MILDLAVAADPELHLDPEEDPGVLLELQTFQEGVDRLHSWKSAE